MAASKPVTKKKIAKKRPRTKTKTKTNVKSAAAESSQAQPVRAQRATIETAQVGSGSGSGSGFKRNVVSWIALALSGLALGVGGLVWYLTAVGNSGQQELQFNQRFDTIAQRVDEFDATQSDNHNALSQLKTQLTQTTDDVSRQIKTIQNNIVTQKSASEHAIDAQTNDFCPQFDTLSDAMLKLRAELGRGVDSWTLEKAEQLIFMANQQLQFGGQFARGNNIAKRALLDADALLQQLADPRLNALRRLLTVDIMALDNVKVVDTVGVLNMLSALSDTVDNLALAGDIVIPEKTATRTTTDTASAQATSNQAQVSGTAEPAGTSRYIQPIIDAGASFMSSMTDLIQVEKNGKSIKPVISAAVRQMTYQRTQLMLDSAQIAFMRQQPELYRNRIQAARSWVEEHFDQNADETVNWLARLNDVGSISPQSKLADISASLEAIQNIIKTRNQESVSVEQRKAE